MVEPCKIPQWKNELSIGIADSGLLFKEPIAHNREETINADDVQKWSKFLG